MVIIYTCIVLSPFVVLVICCGILVQILQELCQVLRRVKILYIYITSWWKKFSVIPLRFSTHNNWYRVLKDKFQWLLKLKMYLTLPIAFHQSFSVRYSEQREFSKDR